MKKLQSGPQLLEARRFKHELSRCDEHTEAPVPVQNDLRPPEHLDHQAQPHGVPLPVLLEAVNSQEAEVLFLRGRPAGGRVRTARQPLRGGDTSDTLYRILSLYRIQQRCSSDTLYQKDVSIFLCVRIRGQLVLDT